LSSKPEILFNPEIFGEWVISEYHFDDKIIQYYEVRDRIECQNCNGTGIVEDGTCPECGYPSEIIQTVLPDVYEPKKQETWRDRPPLL